MQLAKICDIYPGDVHAFDMLMSWKAESCAAAEAFMERYRRAAKACFVEQPGAAGEARS